MAKAIFIDALLSDIIYYHFETLPVNFNEKCIKKVEIENSPELYSIRSLLNFIQYKFNKLLRHDEGG